MGKRGPPPTPLRILELRGSNRATRRGEEPRADGKKPTVPSWLTKEERVVFRRLATQLYEMRVVGTADQTALARYCRLLRRWLELEAFVREHGQTYVRRGRPTEAEPAGPILEVKLFPHAREARNLSTQLLQLEREFGLTPAGRTRLAGPAPPAAGSADASKQRFLA